MKNEVYVVVSGRHYGNGEEYFGSDAVFSMLAAAQKYINDDLEETLAPYDKDDFDISIGGFSARAEEVGSDDEFFWNIEKHTIQ